jgi:glycerol uptake facilitator-like aquaporin
LLAEFLGSAFLAAVVIGSGIAAARLSPTDIGLELFENAAATAAGLFTIILMFGPVSGGHFNPVVSLVDASFGGLRWRDALAYTPAQIAGCITGAITANAMFAQTAITISTKPAPNAATPHPRPSAPTSAPPTSSRAQPASPTPLSPSAEFSPTASPASRPRRSQASSQPSSSAALRRSSFCERSTRT